MQSAYLASSNVRNFKIRMQKIVEREGQLLASVADSDMEV